MSNRGVLFNCLIIALLSASTVLAQEIETTQSLQGICKQDVGSNPQLVCSGGNRANSSQDRSNLKERPKYRPFDNGKPQRPAPDYFFGVFTCFGFRFSRPRLSLLTPAVCHDSLNLHPTISSRPRESLVNSYRIAALGVLHESSDRSV
jgi:hypothetical protein